MNSEIKPIPGGNVTSPKGFVAGAAYAGIKKPGDNVLDLAVLYSEASCRAAGVFTQSKVRAPSVLQNEGRLSQSANARAVVVNSGCANACTGEPGRRDASRMAALLGKNLGVPEEEVLVASTGVIGVRLPMDKIEAGVAKIILTRDGSDDFTRAIMTTDTRPKAVAVKVQSGQSSFTVAGTAKGSGMIHPNMATMLAFVTTDADVDTAFLKEALRTAVDLSLNMVTVDGDTSTNDTVLLLANGLAGNDLIRSGSSAANDFQRALTHVCTHLARAIAADGEGATKLIEVVVDGAVSLADARLAARTIAGSSLVKAAVYGCDPNWGRIIAAAGRSGAQMDESRTDVFIGDVSVFKAGSPQPFDKKALAAQMACQEVMLGVDLHQADFSAVAWGCDLTEEYVKINAEYTT